MTEARPTAPAAGAPGPRRIVFTLARKEILEMSRDGRFRVIGATVVLLLLVALAVGWRHTRAVQAERAAAAAEAVEHWRGQGEVAPHAAAHYGTFVFKPAPILSVLDPGIEPFVGVAVRLEAHRVNPIQDAAARDGTALERFGRFSVASMLQLLLPILVIALSFAAFSGERERGTLVQLASLGVSPVKLALGKALGVAGGLGLVLLPAAVIGTGALVLLGGGGEAAHGHAGGAAGPALARVATLVPAYLAYFGIFLAVSLLVSAIAPSSRAALVVLLGFWVVTTLLAPRAVVDLVVERTDLPSAAALTKALETELAEGPDAAGGGPGRQELIAARARDVLARHGVQGGEVPPHLSADGIELQAEAEYENAVFDRHLARYWGGIARQERWLAWGGLLTPLVAIRSVSMGLSGTDVAHHRHFDAAAERHRRLLVELMNDDMIRNSAGREWDYKASREVWERVPPFVYESPPFGVVLARQLPALGAILLWLGAGVAGTWLAVRRLRVL